jgi:Domain of unknown function (DUF4440)
MRAVLSALLALGWATACQRPAAGFGADQAAAVADSARAFLAEFARLSNAAQWDSLGRLYSDRTDFRFLESGEVRYASAAAIHEALRAVPAGTSIRTEYSDVTVQPIAPGIAGISARFATQFVDSTGPLFGFSGAVSLTLQHEPDGWRIIAGHSSAPVPRGG